MWVAWIRHQRPIDIGMVEQPFDRPRARPGEAVLDLLHLLGDVDVDRAIGAIAVTARQLVRRHGAQAVRRDADDALESDASTASRLVSSSRAKPFEIVDETPLAVVRRGAAEAGMRIEDRQQRQADAGRARRRRDALGHLGDVGIGPPVAVVVQVVELADAA